MRSHLSLNQKKKTCPNRLYVSLPGFDTISTALSWSVMYLVAYPEIQERLYQEMSKYSTVPQNTVKKVRQDYKLQPPSSSWANSQCALLISRGICRPGSHALSLWQTQVTLPGGLYPGNLSPFFIPALHHPSLVRLIAFRSLLGTYVPEKSLHKQHKHSYRKLKNVCDVLCLSVSARQKTHLWTATSFPKTPVSSSISGRSTMIRKFFVMRCV